MERSDEEYALLAEKDLIVLRAGLFLRDALLKWGIRILMGFVPLGILEGAPSWMYWLLCGWIFAVSVPLGFTVFFHQRILRTACSIEQRSLRRALEYRNSRVALRGSRPGDKST